MIELKHSLPSEIMDPLLENISRLPLYQRLTAPSSASTASSISTGTSSTTTITSAASTSTSTTATTTTTLTATTPTAETKEESYNRIQAILEASWTHIHRGNLSEKFYPVKSKVIGRFVNSVSFDEDIDEESGEEDIEDATLERSTSQSAASSGTAGSAGAGTRTEEEDDSAELEALRQAAVSGPGDGYKPT